MKFTRHNLEIIRETLKRYANTIAHNRVLPQELRSNADYELRMKRKAAVLVPIANVDGEASIIFTVRAIGLNTHAAQVAFPGGHVDEGETLQHAAIRELKEETNLDGAETLGMWSAARAYTGTMVTPLIGFIPKEMTAVDVQHCGTFAPEEVSAAFHLSVEHLINPANRQIEILTSLRTARFSGGPEPIWGLTAFFLEGILRDVLGPSLGLTYIPSTTATSTTNKAKL